MVEKDKLAVLGKLAGQIAHELRTPLSIINNSVYLLRREGCKDQKLFAKRISTLEDKVKLSSNILESILSYSRVKADLATIVSMKHCIEEVLKDIQLPEQIKKGFRHFFAECEKQVLPAAESERVCSRHEKCVREALEGLGKRAVRCCQLAQVSLYPRAHSSATAKDTDSIQQISVVWRIPIL